MESHRNGLYSIIAAILGALVSYFLTTHHASKQNDQKVAALRNELAVAKSSTPPLNGVFDRAADTEKLFLQKKISDLQNALATEVRERGDTEDRAEKSKVGEAILKEKSNKLETRLSELQGRLDSASKRIESDGVQLKKFSEDAQRRMDRARENFKAGRFRLIPAPDGSGRKIAVVYDERGADVISRSMVARFRAGD